jgi:hypothetical protein
LQLVQFGGFFGHFGLLANRQHNREM